MRLSHSEFEKAMGLFLLRIVEAGPSGAGRRDLPPADHRARQTCREKGLAKYAYKGAPRKRWHITPKGIDWLNGREA